MYHPGWSHYIYAGVEHPLGTGSVYAAGPVPHYTR